MTSKNSGATENGYIYTKDELSYLFHLKVFKVIVTLILLYEVLMLTSVGLYLAHDNYLSNAALDLGVSVDSAEQSDESIELAKDFLMQILWVLRAKLEAWTDGVVNSTAAISAMKGILLQLALYKFFGWMIRFKHLLIKADRGGLMDATRERFKE